MRLKSLLIPAAAILISSAISFALQFPEVGTDDVKKMLGSKSQFVLIDSRPLDEYKSGHIAGAINIAPDQLTFVRAFLPADRNIQLVIYCRGFG